MLLLLADMSMSVPWQYFMNLSMLKQAIAQAIEKHVGVWDQSKL